MLGVVPVIRLSLRKKNERAFKTSTFHGIRTCPAQLRQKQTLTRQGRIRLTGGYISEQRAVFDNDPGSHSGVAENREKCGIHQCLHDLIAST